MKKILPLAMLALSSFTAFSQTPIPLNPDVRHGVLENGLTYYILHNEEPKERADFYIAQKVGSTLETSEQLGLAHFLEHMAFNGTRHYPGKNMLNYLQSKGIRFGADINAYTGFDETVYNINNVPSTDKALVDSVLLVLSDWSGSILLEEAEIDAERGVIEEEWRTRQTANIRMMESVLPQIYSEYQYQQMPIGKMEVVRNFKPQALRDYYKKWYRPDQQGIIIVGDIDADEMEKKVKDLFSKIPMPENAAPRVYPTVSDNKEPIFASYVDKEMPYTMVEVSFKSDQIPTEYRNTMEAYVSQEVVMNLICKMINNRLDEYGKDPKCKYSFAGTDFGNFLVSSTKAAFSIQIIAKDDIRSAYNDAVSIVARACKTGFMQSELVRARDEMLANYERAYNERNNTRTTMLARRLIRTFIDNTANPGAEKEYELVKQILPMIPVQAVNQASAQILTPENQVILVSRPLKDQMEEITADIMTGDLKKMLDAEYTPYVDEELPATLLEKAPKAGKIVSEKPGAFGTTVFTLSNGARVIVKPTDFKADEILITGWKEGGRNVFTDAQGYDVNVAEDVVGLSKIGKYSRTTVDKYLAGKKADIKFSFGNTVTNIEGATTVKDLPVAAEMLYLTMTSLQPDTAAVRAMLEQSISIIREQEKSPQFIFSQRLNAAQACNSELYNAFPSVKMLESCNYQKSLDLARNAMSNAADYTFLFTGNVNLDSIRPLITKYIASLPSKGKADKVKVVTPRPRITGQVNDHFDIKMATPSTQVYYAGNGERKFNMADARMMTAAGDILDNTYTETLREEEGGTYSPQGFGNLNPYTGLWTLGYWFQTNADVQQKLIDRANAEMSKLLKEGAKPEAFNKVKQAMMKQYEIQVRTNKYWSENLSDYFRGYDMLTDGKSSIENMTLEGLNAFMRGLDPTANRLSFIMTGVQDK